MKSVFTTLLALLCYVGSIGAQAPNEMEQKLEDMLSQLSTTEITTGLLYDRIPEYYPYRYNTGKYVEDSISMHRERYLYTYGMLYKAHLQTPNIPEPTTFVNAANTHSLSDTIFLSGLYYQYNRLKPSAMDDNLLSYDGIHFQDVVGRSESPYTQDTVFTFSTMRLEYEGMTVKFYLPSSDIYSNINGLTGLEIDFDDSTGYKPLVLDSLYTLTYTQDSLHRIRIKYSLASGEELISQTLLMIQPPSTEGASFNPDNYDVEPSGSFENDGVTVHYWYNKKCNTACVRKPLIMVEGFDPGHKYDYKFLINKDGGFLNSKYNLPSEISKLIHEESYDLFFINYKDAKIAIPDNAHWVELAIDEINKRKHDCGSYEKNVVIGASMGGLVGKWALSTMETKGKDHETEFFISVDSPLKGANIILGVQAMIYDLKDETFFGVPLTTLKPDIGDGFNSLDCPAARQMLLYHKASCENSNCDGTDLDNLHEVFQQQFDQKTLIIPHYAIANGSINNKSQEFEARSILLNDKITDGWSDLTYIAATGYSNWTDIWALPGKEKENQVYHKYSHTVLLGIYIPKYNYLNVSNVKNYDNAPGGTRSFVSLQDEFPWKQKNFCFIPTASALGLDPSQFLNNDLSNVKEVLSSGSTYIRSYDGPTLPLP
ncbi:MAG TPA: hypothetical protein PK006_13570 [Saprospiraceae bacterium]|nr:hypothetical protein [Saprospiraceae bacterium]